MVAPLVTFASHYGLVERALHRLAFALPTAQLGLADLEERWFRNELGNVVDRAPVFVTALPRAGTTTLLGLLAGSREFAAHTYRDMPFVLSPMLWHSLARRFARSTAPIERAHGDGIAITLDSPEALEEVLWRVFWPGHYGPRSLQPWRDCASAEFVAAFAAHRRKIIALRRRDKSTAARYVAKNNATIARAAPLLDAVPHSTCVVLHRSPLQHAASLLRQHRRFLELQRDDGFGRRYMRGIGHFEFGLELRPIDFGGWSADQPPGADTTIGFWLEYWVATYRHLLAHRHPRLLFVGFERLGASLGALAEALDVDDRAELLQRAAATLQRAPEHEEVAVDGALRTAAFDTWDALRRASVLS